MIKTSKAIKVCADRVDRIFVEERFNYEPFEFSQLVIHVWTEKEDEVEVVLTAASPENLKLNKENWEKPLVYTGED